MKFWDFKYERINKDEVIGKFNNLTETLKESRDIQELKVTIDAFLRLEKHVNSMFTIASIRNSINTKDEFYDNEINFINENSPVISETMIEFKKVLNKHSLKSELMKIYGEYWFKKIELELKTFDSKILEDLVEENKLSTEYDKLLASAEIEFEDNIYNLSQMAKFGQNLDRNIRKKAAIKVDNFFRENSEKISNIYDKLVKVRTSMARKLGYDNYVELGYARMGRTDYNSKMVSEYRKSILENVCPLANELRHQQALRIKISDPQVYDYTVHFLDGNPTPKGNKDELVQKALKMYNEMSEETGEFFNFMITHDLMDLETKPGKSGGGYCAHIGEYKAPFIFSNFNGTSGDVDVLTHEHVTR